MTTLLTWLAAALVWSLPLALAQADTVTFDPASATLSYDVSYERTLETGAALECSRSALESGLLHSALRHMFLFLPLEASYYDGAEVVQVRVLRAPGDEQPILRLSAPLESLRATNSTFRVFMNSFASPKAGFCFSLPPETLETWLRTFSARGGRLAFDETVFQSEAVEVMASLDAAPLPALAESASEPEAAAQVTPEPATEAAPVPEAEAAAPAGTAPAYEPVPYLSETPVRRFDGAQDVLEPATDYAAIIETSEGSFSIDLFEDVAPRTVNNFVFLALNRFYEGVPFHRVIDGFMAQTGDPMGTGLGGPGYQFADEVVAELSHSAPGVVSVANAGPDTNGSQFFITFEPAEYLDGAYSIFGLVTQGLDVLGALPRTDPTAPLAVATLDTTLGLLGVQGVTLEGNPNATLEAYLQSELGAVPDLARRVSVGAYDLVLEANPQTGGTLAGFWPRSARVVSVQIVARPKL